MLDLARHIANQKPGEFDPEKFEDHYESALIELINQKRAGKTISASTASRTSGNVIDLMDALRKSLKGEPKAAPTAKPKRRVAGQKEMLLPISGKKETTAAPADRKKVCAKPARTTARASKAG